MKYLNIALGRNELYEIEKINKNTFVLEQKMITDHLVQCCICKKVMKANQRESKVEKGKTLALCPFCKSPEFQAPKLNG